MSYDHLSEMSGITYNSFPLSPDGLPDAVYAVNEHRKVLWANYVATSLLGGGVDLAGRDLRDVLGKSRFEMVWSTFEMQFIEREEFEYIEFDATDDSGVPRWLGQRSRLSSLPGQPPIIVAQARDISTILNDRLVVSRSEEKYRGMIQNSSLGLLEVDPEEVILFANKTFCEITGYAPEELVGQKANRLLLPPELEEQTKKMETVQEQRSSGVANAYEIQIRRKDGELRWVLISGAPVYDGNGRFIGSMGIHHDITVQKTEALLRAKLLQELDIQNDTLREQKEHLTAINSFASGLLNCSTVGEVFRHIGFSVRGKLGFVDCLVYFANHRAEVLEFDPSYFKGIDPGFPGLQPLIRLPLGQGITGSAALHGKLEMIADTASDTRYIRDRGFSYGKDGSFEMDMNAFTDRRSELAVPIMNEGEVLGVIDTGHPEQNFFRDIHCETLLTMAFLAGVKIRQIRTAASLQESEARTRSIIDSSLDAVFTVNADGIITDVNRQASGIFGYTKTELTGKPFRTVLAKSAIPSFDALISDFTLRYTSFPENQRLELDIISGNGDSLMAELSIARVVIKGDAFLSVFVRDITIRKKAEQELRSALAREAELNTMKTGFITMTSHEFRTPLTTIQSTSELMMMHLSGLDGPVRDKMDRYVDRIIGEVTRLTALMNDILVLGRIDAGKIPFNPIQLDVQAYLHEVLDGKQFLAGDDRVPVVSVNGNAVPVKADPPLLSHIMTNLVSNALKYSKGAQPPEVNLDFTGPAFMIQVRDYGIGIPEEEIKNLFQSFYRASNAENIQGTGLGLAIVRQFVEMHGGRLGVESNLGEGAVFSIELPFQQLQPLNLN
ncbi:MAG: PAS domain S-box protein [Bacteroidota bacterium]